MSFIQKNMVFAKSGMLVVALAVCIHATAAQAQVITDYSNFSESGNILNSVTNTREQSFSPNDPTALDVTITSVSGTGAGQEMYTTAEFPTLQAGQRVSLDLVLDDLVFDDSQNRDRVGLAIASSTSPGTRENIVAWTLRGGGVPQGGGAWNITTFDASGNEGEEIKLGQRILPETLFIERSTNGWTFGYIEEGVETIAFTDITTVTQLNGTNEIDITADGSAIGIWSDIRTNTASWVVTNLRIESLISGDFNDDGTIDGTDFIEWQRDTGIGNLADWQATYGDAASISAVPEPASLLLLGFGMLPVFTRRTR